MFVYDSKKWEGKFCIRLTSYVPPHTPIQLPPPTSTALGVCLPNVGGISQNARYTFSNNGYRNLKMYQNNSPQFKGSNSPSSFTIISLLPRTDQTFSIEVVYKQMFFSLCLPVISESKKAIREYVFCLAVHSVTAIPWSFGGPVVISTWNVNKSSINHIQFLSPNDGSLRERLLANEEKLLQWP